VVPARRAARLTAPAAKVPVIFMVVLPSAGDASPVGLSDGGTRAGPCLGGR
jgi:hypothetical protein